MIENHGHAEAEAARGTGEQGPGAWDKAFAGAPISGDLEYVTVYGKTYALWSIGYVYLATFENPPHPVKIGWSQNPDVRVLEIGYLLSEKLKILETVAVPRGSALWGTSFGGLEQRLHRSLSQFRVSYLDGSASHSGEWYELTNEDVRDVADYARWLVEREAV